MHFKRIRRQRLQDLAMLLRANDLQAFCTAIGWIEINWAMVEQQFDRWMQVIFHRLGGNALEKRVPRNFSEKVRFLRRAFTDITLLAPFRDKGLSIIKRTDEYSNMRHNLMHAVVAHVEPIGGKFTMTSLRLDAQARQTVTDFVFDVNQFPTVSADFQRLGTEAIELSLDLIERFGEPR
jgi:hypothetical protein